MVIGEKKIIPAIKADDKTRDTILFFMIASFYILTRSPYGNERKNVSQLIFYCQVHTASWSTVDISSPKYATPNPRPGGS